MLKKKETRSQKIKRKARRNLKTKIKTTQETYIVDTSSVINKFLPRLLKRGLKGKIIIPNAVISELENLANKGAEEGFVGLDEIAKLHKYKQIKISFVGKRPNELQIKYAKSGEIDALIIELARKNKAILITADLVQAKSAQAYGLKVIFLKPKVIKKKKKSFFSLLKK